MLEGKTIVVTGAMGALGTAVALAVEAAGAKVARLDPVDSDLGCRDTTQYGRGHGHLGRQRLPERSIADLLQEIQHVVEHAIDELPEGFRLVFITRVIEGMNVEETAEILGLRPETVKTRLHRARTMLRDNVEKKIGPVVMEAFPFAGKRCERLTDAVLKRLGIGA